MAIFTAIGGLALGAAAAGTAAATVAGVAITGAVVGTYAAVQSVKSARAGAAAQRRAADVQIQQTRQSAARSRRSAIRAGIAERSRLRAQAQAAGLQGSSALGGGISSISSQLGSNIGYSNMMSGLSQQYTDLTAQSNLLASQSQVYSTYSNLGFAAASRAPQIAKFIG